MTLSRFLTRARIEEAAGRASFSRGVAYAEEGRVSRLRSDNVSVTANVRGTRLYHVKLWRDKTCMKYTCDCPLSADGDVFCKHCVAVGLAFLSRSTEIGRGHRPHRELSMDQLRGFLDATDKETLVQWLLDAADEDDRLKSRLMMQAGKSQAKVHLPTFCKAIDQAAIVDYMGGEFSMYEYSQGIGDVMSSLRDLLSEGHATEVMQLSEHLINRLVENSAMVDDSDGFTRNTMHDATLLHHSACRHVKPDPMGLARRLFDWTMEDDAGVFDGAIDEYADVLGKKGMEAFRSSARKAWEALPALRAGDKENRFSAHRYQITGIMEEIAESTGDVDALVAVKKKDLSGPHEYLEIAELYQNARRMDDAIRWAEEGVKQFPQNANSPLREFLALQYHKRNRHADAMKLIWAEFADYPCLESYKSLKKHASKGGQATPWKAWRVRAMLHLRGLIEKSERPSKSSRWAFPDPSRSSLVRILLWEKDVEGAWLHLQSGKCDRSLWIEVAGLRESAHPEDSLAVYRSYIEPTLARKSNDAYEDAIGLLKRSKAILTRLGKQEEWGRYLAEVKVAYKRLRNFIAMLQKLE